MKSFRQQSNYSLVTAILPRASTSTVLNAVLDDGAAHALTLSARGSVLQNRWYDFLLPALSPEQEILNFLVPTQEADTLMEQIVMVGKLQLYGAGSIYATPCDTFYTSNDYPLWTPGNYTYESVSYDIRFNKNLVALIHITDKGQAEPITKAALKAGAPGATISYIRGFGLRDRLGLLRITKSHEKELITVVLDKYDVDAVAQVMAEVGRVDQPGRGIIYQMPISKGLTNLASVFSAQRHSASIQQIIQAIDQLQGDTKWRANQLLIHDPKAAEFQATMRGTVNDLVVLNLVCHRKDAEGLLLRGLDEGIPGASLSNWRFTESKCEKTTGGQRINREFACMAMILPPEKVDPTRELLSFIINELELKEACFFSHAIPSVRTYAASPLNKQRRRRLAT